MTIFQYTKIVVCLLLLSVPAMLWAQSGSLVLNGMMKLEDGTEYKYSLNLDVNGNNLKGLSITQQDKDLMKMKLNGKLNREKKSLVFTENAHLGVLPDTMEMCYVSAVVKWRLKKGKYLFNGTYIAKKKNGVLCGNGKLVLETTEQKGVILSDNQDIQTSVFVDTVKKAPIGEHELTEGADKKLEWVSQECVLEIWDAGVIDGDELTVLVNGKVLISNFSLKGEKKKLVIPLTEKQTKLTFVAGSEGSSPPNTAQMILTDGGKHHKIMYYNKKGKTANITIVKK
jgi:hypothetical protein